VRIDARLQVLYLAGAGSALFHTGRAGVIGGLLAL